MNFTYMLETLESFKSRKPMYISPVDSNNTANFLLGFRLGYYSSQGLIPGKWMDIYDTVLEERNWSLGGENLILQMKEFRMEDEEIMDELIEIEIDILKRYSR